MSNKQNLPNANSVGSGNLTNEFYEYNYLLNLLPRSTSGNITFTSSSSGITYDTSAYSSGLYASQGQNGMMLILQSVLADYILSAIDFNNKLDKTGDTMTGQLISSVATGIAPFQIASTTLVSNLNADLLNGQHGSYYAPINNTALTGTPTAPTVIAGTNNTQIANTAFVMNQIGYLHGSQIFTSSGIFTVPSNVYIIAVALWGAFGGGGSSNSGTVKGGSGASGGFTFGFISVTPGQQITVTIGAGGVGGVYSGTQNGGTGGTTVIGLLSAYGGGGGGVASGTNGLAGIAASAFSLAGAICTSGNNGNAGSTVGATGIQSIFGTPPGQGGAGATTTGGSGTSGSNGYALIMW